jgi:hypothetical protein
MGDARARERPVIEPAVVHGALTTLLRELVDGAAQPCWVLNAGDAGLLRSLDKLSAAAASAPAPGGGASIAAHVDHLCYGFGLMNRWSQGEDPWGSADWSASWRRHRVTDDEWVALRQRLAAETHRWLEAVRQPRPLSEFDLTQLLASVVHLAYHLGAMRQMDRATRGPAAED